MILKNLSFGLKNVHSVRKLLCQHYNAYHISIEPQSCLQDIPATIRATGLKPNEKTTFTVKTKDDKGEEFFSYAHYKANNEGSIDLENDVSEGGAYKGCLPMGLVSSLRHVDPEKRYHSFFKKNIEDSLKLKFNLFAGFLEAHKCASDTDCLASASHQRHFMAEGVRRIPVRDDKLRGALYLPAGQGPFPGIVDIYGSNGGLKEVRAAQFASNGIAALALAYFRYEDLPKLPTELDLDYFESAVHYLLRQKEIIPDGVGAIGSSKGADVALAMGIYLKEVKAVVGVNAIPAISFWPLKTKTKTFPCLEPDGNKAQFEDNMLLPREMMGYSQSLPEAILPIEEANAELMFVVGKDDQNWHTDKEVALAVEKLRKCGRSNFEVVECPGTGHLIEPPFGQFQDRFYHHMTTLYLFVGGNLNDHSVSELMAWKKMIAFFKNNLANGPEIKSKIRSVL